MKLFAVIELKDCCAYELIAVFKTEKDAQEFVDALPDDPEKSYDIEETVLIE